MVAEEGERSFQSAVRLVCQSLAGNFSLRRSTSIFTPRFFAVMLLPLQLPYLQFLATLPMIASKVVQYNHGAYCRVPV
jgi:hypothetical protein